MKVRSNRPGAAESLKFSFLQNSQKFGLQLQRNVAYLVEKEGSLVGQLNASDFPRDSPSKRTLLVAKQFAFEQPGWYGGARRN